MDALREIIASFTASFDGKELQKGHSQVDSFTDKLKEFGQVAAEAFGFYEVKEFAYGLAEQAEQLEINAKALGISTDALQKWQYAANISGVSAEEMQLGLQRLQRSAVGAKGGGSELGATFAKLHVSVKNASGGFKNADELLTDVAGAIGDMKDPTEQTAVAMQLFGRGGARLLPFLKQGREGMAALKEEVEALGGGFSEEFIAKSTEMVQNTKRLDFAMTGLKTSAIGPLLPLVTEFVKWLTKGATSLGELIKHSNVAQAALVTFGTYGLVKTAAGVVGLAQKLGLLKRGLGGLVLEMAPLTFAFLILEDLWTFFTGGKSLTGDALDKLFGPGTAKKVQAFANKLKDDVGPVLKDVLAIFTDGKPLSEKFQELYTYVNKTLTPQFKADFGEMSGSMINLIEAAGHVAEAISKIVDAMKWIGQHTINAVGGAIFSEQDKIANSKARLQADYQAGKPLATVEDFNNRGWATKAMQWLVGFKPEMAVPQVNPGSRQLAADTSYLTAEANVATAPMSYAPTEPNVTNNTTTNNIKPSIVVNVAAGTPQQVGRETASEIGRNLRTQNALVPTVTPG